MFLGFFMSFVSLFFFFDYLIIFWISPFFLFMVFLFYGGFSDGVFFCDSFSLLLLFITLGFFFFL